MGRPTQVTQDSELGLLPTTTEYLPNFTTRVTNPRGYKTTTTYYAWDTPTQDYPNVIAHPEGATTSIERDAFGKTLSLLRTGTDGSWQRRYFRYNAQQELCNRTELESVTTALGYDAAGNLAWSAGGLPWQPNGCPDANDPNVLVRRAIRTYDQRNRVTALSFQDGRGDTSYAYTPDGQLQTLTVANASGNGDQVTTSYASGNVGNRDMTYDGLDRLKTVVAPKMFGSGATYAYDALDNMTRVAIGGAKARDHYYCYDTNLRLSNVKTGSCSGSSVIGLGYDVQGNLANKNGVLYAFDYGNRLRTVTQTSGAVSTYAYDGHGRRVRATDSGVDIFSMYTMDGTLIYQEDLKRNKRIYHAYLAGDPVAQVEVDITTGTATNKYLHTDALGSPVAVTNATSGILERTQYEPYGLVINRALRDGPGYTGHVEDAATGLTYMQQRYNDPVLGRFLSVDPVTAYSNPVGAFNRYWYANNNPYKFTDPDGRQSVPVRTAIPESELTNEDRAAIAAGNRGQRYYERAVMKSGDKRVIDSYLSTKVEYRRELSPEAQALQDANEEGSEGIRAYREPGKATITILPGFSQFGDSSKTFPDYHGMELGRGGDATLFQVTGHEQGHVLDMANTEPHDREAAASDHSNRMKEHASPQIKRELRDR